MLQFVALLPFVPKIKIMELFGLCFFAFLAGFIDSMVGGGGLIQLPALFIFFPNTNIAALIGTSKLVSICGTTAAAIQFTKQVKLDFRALLPYAVTALIFSFLGARTVSVINSEILRPVVLSLLIVVTIYTFIKKDFGEEYQPRRQNNLVYYMMLIAGSVGFYDGFFGPGTGSFLIFLFIAVLGFDFIRASATAKIINWSTNLAALVYFVFIGKVLYSIALPMALCNVIGGILGARMAIVKGSAFVRVIFLIVVSGLIIKLAYDILIKYVIIRI